MSWSGGVYTRTNGVFSGALVWTSDFNAGTLITSDHHDTHDQDLAQGINATINKNGQNSPTANINWGTFKITNLSYGSADKDSATYGQTVTAATVDPSTKILTLTRTQGNVTVDLTPITVAGDTSDFARKSQSNNWTGANDFSANSVYMPSTINIVTGGVDPNWTFTVDTNDFYILKQTDTNHGLIFTISGTYPSGAALMIAGNQAWHAGNLNPANYLTTTGNYTITGNWTFNGGTSFGGTSLQVPSNLVIAGSGYSWTISTPSPTTLQLTGSGGNFLRVDPDATYTSKISSPAGTVWDTARLKLVTSGTPTGGIDGALAIVKTGAQKGVWLNIAGTWTLIAA